LREFLLDFEKYILPAVKKQKISPREIIKNCWVNMARSINFADINKDKLLLDASYRGWKPAVIKMLFNQNANLDARDNQGYTPAIHASRNGHAGVLYTLLELKASINSRSNWGRTPIHYAVRYKQEDCVSVLMENSCSLQIRDKENHTALDLAEKHNNDTIRKLLKSVSVSSILGSPRSSINRTQSEKWESDLNLAEYFDTADVPRERISSILQSKSIVLNMKNILQVLWFGGEVEHRDEHKKTPLIHCAECGDQAALDTLLEAGANVNAKDESGWTALLVAIKHGSKEAVQTLIDAEANIHDLTKNGKTTLYEAVNHGCVGKVRALLKAGADVSASADRGESLLDLAKSKGKVEIYNVLQSELDCKLEI